MSVQNMCKCKKINFRVLHRNHNHSYFEYPKGQEHFSNYSGIICLKCSMIFRSKACWVNEILDINKKELKKMGINKK